MTNSEAIEIIKKDGWGYPENMHTQAVMMAIEALEKQNQLRISRREDSWYCPDCGNFICDWSYIVQPDYCPFCGQALDWSEVEE